MPVQRAMIYVRLSVSQDASVSITRQIEACQDYAQRQGWDIVDTFTDDGVSATANRPEDRKGWAALMADPRPWDVVIIWKLDRLIRRVVNFWDTYKTLEAREKSLVSVHDSLDMTTAVGRMIAGILAGFAEMEAEATSTRVTAARGHLLRTGRHPGGTVPYGWRAVVNESGPGYVLEQDPEKIDYVRLMADRARAGRSIYSTVQYLDEIGAPLPDASQAGRKTSRWSYSTVERLLRNPVLAGMIPYNRGNQSGVRGERVLIGDDGLPVVDEAIAIMRPPEWRAMVQALDARDTPQARPRALKSESSGVLSGLVACANHDGEPVRMWRSNVNGRQGYKCPRCKMSISNFEHVVIEDFLYATQDEPRWSVVDEVHDGGQALRQEISAQIDRLSTDLKATDDPDDVTRILGQIQDLKARESEAASLPSTVEYVPRREVLGSFPEEWQAVSTDEDRRDVIGDAIRRVWVHRARPGRRNDAQIRQRLVIEWIEPYGQGPRQHS